MSDYIKREDAIFVALQQPLYSVVSQIKSLEGIDLADYVPREFHDKTCEAMAKAHQEEIADMVSVVRCKECRWAKPNKEGDYDCKCHIPIFRVSADDYCSYGEREGE